MRFGRELPLGIGLRGVCRHVVRRRDELPLRPESPRSEPADERQGKAERDAEDDRLDHDAIGRLPRQRVDRPNDARMRRHQRMRDPQAETTRMRYYLPD